MMTDIAITELPREGIGPAPDRCLPHQKQAWDDLVRLVGPGFLIWRDAIWMELAAGMVAQVRLQEVTTPEEVSAVCYMLKGLTLGTDALPKLGFDFEWQLLPEDE
jgi:hypothetical protein